MTSVKRQSLNVAICMFLLLLLTSSVTGQPTNLRAVQMGGTRVTVEWDAPVTGITPTGYRVFYQVDSDTQFMSVDGINGGAIAHTLTNLKNGETYTIYVAGLLDTGLPSEVVGPVQVTLCKSVRVSLHQE